VRRVIVTGAEGFLGRHLVRDLRQNGADVTTLGRLPRSGAAYVAMGDAPWCPTRLAKVIEAAEPDAIFHLVGGAVGSRVELEQSNVGVAQAVIQALVFLQAHPLLVCCGSAAEYGAAILDGVPICETAECAPISAYGTAKFAQTNAVLAFGEKTGTPVLITRIFNPIGPGMPHYLALGDFARQIAVLGPSHGILQTGDIQVSRDFIDVEHVAKAFRQLAENPEARGVVNICSGRAVELAKLVDILIGLSGKSVSVETNVSRLRSGEFRVVVGSTAFLTRLGAAPPATDYVEVMERIWRDVEMLGATIS
jgi:GDP-4-dehydro-6-deoxy-D-mannose reductase